MLLRKSSKFFGEKSHLPERPPAMSRPHIMTLRNSFRVAVEVNTRQTHNHTVDITQKHEKKTIHIVAIMAHYGKMSVYSRANFPDFPCL